LVAIQDLFEAQQSLMCVRVHACECLYIGMCACVCMCVCMCVYVCVLIHMDAYRLRCAHVCV